MRAGLAAQMLGRSWASSLDPGTAAASRGRGAPSLPCASLQRPLVLGAGTNTFRRGQLAPRGDGFLPARRGSVLRPLFLSNLQSHVASSDDVKDFPKGSSVA